MNGLKKLVGKVLFWLGYPVLWLCLHNTLRTRVLVIVGEEVLLLQSWPGNGMWSLPGGGLHKAEDPVQGALRELREETGLEVRSKQLQSFYEGVSRHYGIHISFICFAMELAEKPSIKKQSFEVAEASWLPLQEVAASNASPDVKQAVQAWLEHQNLL